MASSILRYLKKAPRIVAVVATDPVEACLAIRTKLVARRERRRSPFRYRPDGDWEPRLHEALGAPHGCEAAAEFWALWQEVVGALRAKGMRIGPASFGIWNDGDPEFVRAVWCLTRHLQPRRVVETGVARGLTTRFVLEALERNRSGHLWSIDLPPALDTELHRQIGIAIGERGRGRWSYIKGSSRRRLPRLLSQLGQIDLFIHDSMHTEDNVCFELDHAWAALAPGGAVVVDDVDLNRGFHSFMQRTPGQLCLVCQAAPVEPDPRRFDHNGLFGVIRKSSAQSATPVFPRP